LTRVFDPAHDLYLLDHQIDGRPVLPAAMALELMLELVQAGWPDLQIVEVEDFRVLKGIVLEDGAKTVNVRARPVAQADQDRLGSAVEVTISDPAGRFTYYRSTIRLGHTYPAPPHYSGDLAKDLQPFPASVKEAYSSWLFHGPRFEGIRSIQGISQAGIAAELLPSSPRQLLRVDAEGWLADPLVVDSAFQLAILWSRVNTGMTSLPARFQRFQRFAPFPKAPLHCDFWVRTNAGGHILETDIVFLDSQENQVAFIQGMEFSNSRSLNRLAEHSAKAAGPR
jgi:hypothetical protein